MRQKETLTKSIPTATLDPQIQQLIEQAGQGKLRVIFESDDGTLMAVVMPPGAGKDWEADRQRFFESIREMQQAANLPPDEADQLALE